MKQTTSDVLVDAAHDWNVDVAFDLPGDGINGIMEAFRTRSDKVFMDVAAYNARVMGPNHVQNVVDLASRTALAYRSVAHISYPGAHLV